MPVSSGPDLLGESNLVFALDTHDTSNGITPLGCGGFNGSTQGVKNLLNGDVYQFINGMKLSGRDYYTSFAIDYPEWAYGGDAANRQGITPGYDVRSGGKLYDASRALHLWVYNNDTNSWIDNGATTYFRGARLGGHCYDNYSGAETGYLNEIGLFISDYNTLKNIFPNCTFIVAGSHRADQYTAALRAILYDLGMPTGFIDSDYIAAPEWILIGEPGLGTGNAFGWVYENYTTNAAQVAHINFGLPIKARGGMVFDGTNDYINIGVGTGINQFSGDFTVSLWAMRTAGGNYGNLIGDYYTNSTQTAGEWQIMMGPSSELNLYKVGPGYVISNIASGFSNNTWINVVVTRSGNLVTMYANSNVIATGTDSTSYGTVTGNLNIGIDGNNSSEPFPGRIDKVKIYNRALTAQEVRQNYQQHKTRFNLS
jgi:hypothetical protein